MSRITLQGRDWSNPSHRTAWQAERTAAPTLLPMASDTDGAWKRATWATVFILGALFWTAVFCWILG